MNRLGSYMCSLSEVSALIESWTLLDLFLLAFGRDRVLCSPEVARRGDA